MSYVVAIFVVTVKIIAALYVVSVDGQQMVAMADNNYSTWEKLLSQRIANVQKNGDFRMIG
jgi:uncharacterized membrane protein (Fun14 family)|tara:strand:+ start:4328 stop:4510 length:183 start_codon:yes stop_codon:yes gene_type:complete